MSISSYLVPTIATGLLMTACWLLGRYSFSSIWIVVFAALSLLKSKLWRERERRILALQQAALKEKEVVLAQLKDLPAWVQFPDTERVEWMNRVIFQLWPYIGDYSKQFIKEMIEPQIKALLPGPFRSFQFESIDMGDIPLRVGGIKVYTENVGRDRIIMDMDVAYAGDCEFVVGVGAFKAGLRQMQFKGKLRAILKPLLSKPPLIGGVSVFFLDEPTIDFDLTGLGEFVELPGLLGAVRSIINSQVAAICVLPNEIVVPLTKETDVVKLHFPEPDGVVRIHIYEAKNLEDMDIAIKGKSDPYARVTVGSQLYRTKTIDNSLDPVWDEYFDAVVDQASGQRLRIELFDEDVAQTDEFLGEVSLDLSYVRDQRVIDKWYQLERVKHGEIHLRIVWMDFSTNPASAMENHESLFSPIERKVLKGSKSKPALMNTAVLMMYVDSASNLPPARKNLEPSPFLEFTVGKHVQKTYPRPKTPNPLYQQKFIFFVTSADSQVLKIEAKDDASGGNSLGETSLAVANLKNEERMEMYQHKFQLTLGPHSAFVIMTLRLRYLGCGSRLISNLPPTGHTVTPSPAAPTSGKLTNQIILPSFDLGTSTGDEAWRKTHVSTGAVTPNTVVQDSAANKVFNSLLGTRRRGRKRLLSKALTGELGKLEATIQYTDSSKRLVVIVHRVEQISPLNPDGIADPYIRLRMLKKGIPMDKRSTEPQRETLNPVYEQPFSFELHPGDLRDHTLAFDVKDATNYGIFVKPPLLGQAFFDLAKVEINKSTRHSFSLSRALLTNANGV